MSDKHRQGYQKLLKTMLGLGFLAAALSVVLVAQLLTRPEPDYYATTTTGRVVSINSLSEPIVTQRYILQWASLATRSVLNLHFDSYQDDLQQARGYFTVPGWNSFESALNQSGVLKTITQNKLDASAIVNGDPVVLDREVVSGRYTWRIQLPVLVTYTSASQNEQSHYIVTMNVQRIPVVQLSTGIAISGFSAKRIYIGSN